MVSIAVNPLLYRAVAPLERWLPQRRTAAETLAGAAVPPGAADRDPRHRAVVIGYGPVGRTVARLLRENEITPTIIDLNIDTVRDFATEASQPSTATPRTAKRCERGRANGGLDHPEYCRTARRPGGHHAARELNPSVLILARTAYIRELVTLKQAGATQCLRRRRRSRARLQRDHPAPPRRHTRANRPRTRPGPQRPPRDAGEAMVEVSKPDT